MTKGADHDKNPLLNTDEGDSLTRGSSVWRATCNYLACMFGGVGLLAFPYTIRLGGWASIAAMCLIPIVCCYTGIILMECMYGTDDEHVENVRLRSTWEEIAEACCPRVGAKVIVISRTLHFMLLCSLYLVVSGSLLRGMWSSGPISENWWRVICSVLVLPTVFLQSLSDVAWLSSLSVLSLCLACTTVITACATQAPPWSIDSITQQGGLEGVFIALNAILVGYNAHDILPCIEASMADKSRINSVIFWSYAASTPFKLVFSVLSFLTYTNLTNEIVLENLPSGWISLLTFIPTIISSLCTYTPTMYGVIVSVDRLLPEAYRVCRGANIAWFVTVRVAAAVASLLAAQIIPHFALFASLIGSVLVAAYAYVFPTAFHLCLKRRELSYCQMLADITILLLGLTSGAMGVVFSLRALLGQGWENNV